jgi:hypothetical protein
MSWPDKIARLLGLRHQTRLDEVKVWPSHDDIDPIEELARIINEAQAQGAEDENRFDDLARVDPPQPPKSRQSTPPSSAMILRAASADLSASIRLSRTLRLG